MRLHNDEIEALQRVSATAGLPASTFVRTWILDGNSADAGTDLRSIVRQEIRTAVRETWPAERHRTVAAAAASRAMDRDAEGYRHGQRRLASSTGSVA